MAATAVVVELDQDTEGCDPMTEVSFGIVSYQSNSSTIRSYTASQP